MREKEIGSINNAFKITKYERFPVNDDVWKENYQEIRKDLREQKKQEEWPEDKKKINKLLREMDPASELGRDRYSVERRIEIRGIGVNTSSSGLHKLCKEKHVVHNYEGRGGLHNLSRNDLETYAEDHLQQVVEDEIVKATNLGSTIYTIIENEKKFEQVYNISKRHVEDYIEISFLMIPFEHEGKYDHVRGFLLPNEMWRSGFAKRTIDFLKEDTDLYFFDMDIENIEKYFCTCDHHRDDFQKFSQPTNNGFFLKRAKGYPMPDITKLDEKKLGWRYTSSIFNKWEYAERKDE